MGPDVFYIGYNSFVQKQMLYAWAAEICERADAKLKNEDSRVELKSVWPPERDIARQLAGHANTMRGEPILWLIGVQDGMEVCGIQPAGTKDPGAWFQIVSSGFDGTAPGLVSAFMTWRDRQVCALLFETDSPPYVVKNTSGKGPFQMEVPWRDGTVTRSARKHELIKILAPLQRQTNFEIQEGTLLATKSDRSDEEVAWRLWVKAYVTPPQAERVDLPFHKIGVDVRLNGIEDSTIALSDRVKLSPRSGYGETQAPSITATMCEMTLAGPGRIELYASGHSPLQTSRPDGAKAQHVVGRVFATHAEVPSTFRFDLAPANDRDGATYGRWVYPAVRASKPIPKTVVVSMPEPLRFPFAPLPKPEGW